jgi:nucleoid-associated protein
MAIRSIVFHRITRWQDDQPSELTLAEACADVTADHEGLFSQLKKNFQFKAGKLYGKFDPDFANMPFQNWLKEFHQSKISFEKLSTMYVTQFKDLLDKTSEAFEATFALIHEDRADGARFYIFALESNPGLMIDSRLQLDTTEYLNPGKLDLAIRMDLDDAWENEAGEPYLCMVKSRTKGKTGEAFTQASAFKSVVDSAKETETLIDVLSGYARQMSPKDAANLHQKAYEFCVEQQQSGEPVPLNALSSYVDEQEPDRFADYAHQHASLDTQQTLRPDTRKLKHLVRISGKGNGLSLSFSSDLIQQTILFDEKSDTLTITAIPKALKKQILEHLKSSAETA